MIINVKKTALSILEEVVMEIAIRKLVTLVNTYVILDVTNINVIKNVNLNIIKMLKIVIMNFAKKHMDILETIFVQEIIIIVLNHVV